jgi:isocitrate dehydrogenase
MITISKTYTIKWFFKAHPQYAITTCKKVINTHRGTIVKKTLNGGSIGWWIAGNFIAQSKVNSHVELLKIIECPF